jgi:hypothetical protein
VQVTADSAGVYRACAVPAGAALTLSAAGRTAALTLSQVRVESGRTLLQDVSLAGSTGLAARPAAPGAVGAGGISGVVRAADGRAVAGATVRFGTLVAVTTDAQGRFRLRGVAAGEHEVTVAHASLGTRSVRMAVPANAGEVELRAGGGAGSLAASVQRSVQLAGLNVRARSLGLDIAGFYDRQRRGIGYFLTGERLGATAGGRVTNVLRRVPGVRVVQYQRRQPTPGDKNAVVSRMDVDEEYRIAATRSYSTGVTPDGESSLQFCYMDVWVDGVQVQNGNPEASQSVDRFILANVEGIEVYRGPAEAPPEYRGMWTGCGVVLIWSKK